MKPHIPWLSFSFFGGLSIISTSVAIYTWVVGAGPEPLTVAVLSTLGFIAVLSLFFFKWYTSKPDYITKHGTAVWKDGIPYANKGYMEAALDFFIVRLPELHPNIDSIELKSMLRGACIEMRRRKLTVIGIGWAVRDKAGLQSGKNIMLYWPGGSLHNTELYHELGHMVDELVLCRSIDYEHERVSWWKDISMLNELYKVAATERKLNTL